MKTDSKKTNNKKKPFSLREWLFSLSLDRRMFVYGLALGIPGIAAILLYTYLAPEFAPAKCRFLELTGFYCPGCGCTRAVRSFFHGHFISSFLFNPIVGYCMIMYILYMGSHILELLHVPHIKGMKFRYWYVYAGIWIILGNWVIKNIVMFVINH